MNEARKPIPDIKVLRQDKDVEKSKIQQKVVLSKEQDDFLQNFKKPPSELSSPKSDSRRRSFQKSPQFSASEISKTFSNQTNQE